MFFENSLVKGNCSVFIQPNKSNDAENSSILDVVFYLNQITVDSSLLETTRIGNALCFVGKKGHIPAETSYILPVNKNTKLPFLTLYSGLQL